MNIRWTITALTLATLPAWTFAQEPWQTPGGRACIDRWIGDTTSRLNRYNGDAEFNGRKPWRITRYGLFAGRTDRSNYEPDNWVRYSADRYHWMWGNYTSELQFPGWSNVHFDRAQVIGLRYFVRSCVGGSGGGGGSTSGGGAGGGGAGGAGAATGMPQSCTTSSGAMTFTGATSGRIANFGNDQGRIIGNLARGSIDGYWVEAASNQKCSRAIDGSYYWGRFVARFNGTHFDGKWSYCDAAPTRSWTGDCTMGGSSSGGGSGSRGGGGVSGAWDTSEGRMLFTGKRSGLIATYDSDDGRIVGRLTGSGISGHWVERQSNRRCDTAINGSYYWGRFEAGFNSARNRFEASWSYCNENFSAETWTGRRVN